MRRLALREEGCGTWRGVGGMRRAELAGKQGSRLRPEPRRARAGPRSLLESFMDARDFGICSREMSL